MFFVCEEIWLLYFNISSICWWHCFNKIWGTCIVFLGIKVLREFHGVIFSQWKFTLDLLQKFDVTYISTILSPLDPIVKLGILFLIDLTVYMHMLGKLNYLIHTRPNLAFTVQHLSKYMKDPRLPHLIAALWILR